MHEKEMHEQRQNLLREIEQLRMREETLHKQETIIHETVSFDFPLQHFSFSNFFAIEELNAPRNSPLPN